MLRRPSDPRLDPRLRPHEWPAALRRIRLRRITLLLAVVVGLLIGLTVHVRYPADLTVGMKPEAVAEAAGKRILEADAYRFKVQLNGESRENLFPTAHMTGEYQREPLLLRLSGDVVTGDSKLPLAYYLEGTDLYLQDPRDQSWMLLRQADLDELHSFQPDNLAAPLVSGVRSAEVVGREELPDGEALVLRVNLDPAVMLPHLHGLRSDHVDYRLWVYTRTLEPARFSIEVRPREDAQVARSVLAFTYTVDWEFPGRFLPRKPLSVPKAVKAGAREVSPSSAPTEQLLPDVGAPETQP